MIVLSSEEVELIRATKLAVGDEQPRARCAASDLGQKTRDERTIVGLAVGIGTEGNCLSGVEAKPYQYLRSQHGSWQTTQRFDSLGDALDLLAIERHQRHCSEAQGDQRRGFSAIQLRKSIGRLGEEAFREGQREATEFAISCRIRDRHALLLFSAGEALSAASVVLDQSIADETDQNWKG